MSGVGGRLYNGVPCLGEGPCTVVSHVRGGAVQWGSMSEEALYGE